MELSICILTHSQPKLLPLCVASCFEEIHRAGIAGEVIVIDNASVDRYPDELAKAFPQIRIIRNAQNLSFSVANNAGIRASAATYVLILNDDAILQPGSLGWLLKLIESNPRIGAAGAKLVNPDGSPQADFMHDRFPHLRGTICSLLRLTPALIKHEWSRKLLTFHRNPELSGETNLVVGACLLARRDALLAVGLFDENFHYLFEDVDLCFRLRKAGWQIFYSADVTVTHYGSASLKSWSGAKFFSTWLASTLFYFRKNGKHGQYAALKIVLVPLVFCRMFFFLARDLRPGWRRNKQLAANVRSHLRAITGLFKDGPHERKPLAIGTRVGEP